MNEFKDFGIKPKSKGFEGDKIKIGKVLNKRIKVCDFKEGESKFKEKGSGRCLDLQIEIDGEKRVVFTGSLSLIDMITQVPKDKFPFMTSIIETSFESYEFA